MGYKDDAICTEQCFTHILPGYEGMNSNPTYATDSSAAIIMMVLQYVENPGECIDLHSTHLKNVVNISFCTSAMTCAFVQNIDILNLV